MAAALKNARDPELSNYDGPSFGDLMTETVPKQTAHNALKRLGDKPIALENVFPTLKRSLLPQEMVLFLQEIIGERNEGNNGVSNKETMQSIVGLGGACSDKQA